MTEHYDVVIIGSGAGGGTLAHRLGPVGQEGPHPRARRLAAARAAELGRDRGVRQEPLRLEGHLVRPRRQVVPAAGALQRGRRDEVLRRRALPAARAGLRRAAAPRRRSPRPGRSRYDEFEPYYTQAEELYQVHGARGEDPTEPPSSGPYPFPPVSHEPRIQQLFDDMTPIGLHPFHAPSGIMLNEANPAYSPCIRSATCDGFACLLHAKSDAEVIAVRPAVEHAERHAGPQRPGAPARDRRLRAHGDLRRRGRRRRRAAVLRRRRRGLGGCRNSAKLLLASANDRHPNGLANGSDHVGRHYMFHNSRAFLAISIERNDTRFQKTLGVNDYYFGDEDFAFPMGNVQMVGKSSAPMYRGEKPIAKLAPLFALERGRRARGRLLAVRRGPARPRQPRDARQPRRHRADVHPEQPAAARGAVQPGQAQPRAPRHAPAPPGAPRPVHEERHPGRGLRAPGRHGPVRRRPGRRRCSTATAGRTRWTTSTSSTRSFFPSIGAVNPALTAIANALRVGDHLLARLA